MLTSSQGPLAIGNVVYKTLVELALSFLANGTLRNYLMNIRTHLGPKEVFLEHVNSLVDPKIASHAPSMHLSEKKLSDWPLWNT